MLPSGSCRPPEVVRWCSFGLMEESGRHTAEIKASAAADQRLVGAGGTRHRLTLLDQLGAASATPSGSTDRLFSSPCAPQHFCHLSLSFTLSYPCIVFLILSVNPAPFLYFASFIIQSASLAFPSSRHPKTRTKL